MEDIELRLVETLQPVRGMFLAQVAEFGLRSGLFERIDGAGLPADDLAEGLGWSGERLRGLLRYLAVEGVVTDPEGSPALTARGREILTFRAWYELLVGGYGSSLSDLDALMRSDQEYAGRDGAMVGKGSCGISRYDAIPMVRQLLGGADRQGGVLVDLGCGDGTFLLDLCTGLELPGIGVDPHEPSVVAAREQAGRRGMAEQVRFDVGTAQDFVKSSVEDRDPCFVAAFSLQEVLEQQSRDAVVSTVRTILDVPGAQLVVVEVDHRPTDASVMHHGLGTAYYNPYYLLHQVTEQRLETRAFWAEVFAEAGAAVVAEASPDPRVDSTGLELGYLLRRVGR